ncbi:MAG: hypothetical protein HGB12_00690 [Bacteroidetes bacterium]|nr:hypothetical protein [Bacteroidota bacterium]
MKKILFIAVAFASIITTNIFAQDTTKQVDLDRNYTWLGLGYSAMYFNHQGLNYVIDRYNNTRQGKPGQARLTTKMPKFHLLTGPQLSFGHMNNKFENGLFYEFTFGIYRADGNAEGINADSTKGSRLLQYRCGYYSLTGGIVPIQSEMLDIGFGMSADGFLSNVYTSTSASPSENVQMNTAIGISFFPQIHLFPLTKSFPAVIVIRPYYYLDILPSDFDNLNEKINPSSYDYETEFEKSKGKFSHLGLRVTLNIAFVARKQAATQQIKNRPGVKTKKKTSGF